MSDIKIFAKSIDPKAKEQLAALSPLPVFQGCKIRIMPDVHTGKGCVIGFTAELSDKVIPNVVGVDIGCGMLLTKIESSDIDFQKLDKVIRTYVPVGKGIHTSPIETYDYSSLRMTLTDKEKEYFDNSLGTLGGGNHFIEIDRGEDGSFYLLLHTGSRAFGARVADFYQKKAIASHSLDKEWEEEKRKIIHQRKVEGNVEQIPEDLKKLTLLYQGKTDLPKPLCYLEGEESKAYLNDMKIAQQFALFNRRLIRDILFEHM